jgi:tRNA U34 5-methylaminomethyl-2-thiouridine-forming methyltransferase MnmC
MKRKLIFTSDGSHSISVPDLDVTYHSIHGAIQESKHVFIEAGLKSTGSPAGTSLKIFEMGFGTGLNALLTIIEAQKIQINIYYETIEQFPLYKNEISVLNYCNQLNREDLQPLFEQLHNCEWEKEIKLASDFIFRKSKINLLTFETAETFKLIYFDAFDPNVQPELWTKQIFEKMFAMLEPGGILVTYSSKGDVRRALLGAGFAVEKLPGPKGKREMIRALR